MSPVSRGRKGKKVKKKSPAPAAQPVVRTQPVLRGDWFDDATETVLDQMDELLTARGPLELEEATAKLTGEALHEPMLDHRTGLDFNDWFSALIGTAADEAKHSEAALRLLYGLAATAPASMLDQAMQEISQAPAPTKDWVRMVPLIEASGDVWRLHDIYRSRIALIADFHYPDDAHPSVYLFDIDAGGGDLTFVEPGVYDDLTQAAEAWRAHVGDSAPDTPPALVESPDDLLPLKYVHTGQMGAFGDETRAQADNWFRAVCRIQLVLTARGKRGLPEVPDVPLFHDEGFEDLAVAFTQWYRGRHSTEPDQDAVRKIASEWMRGTLPDVVHSVSPGRVAYYKETLDDATTQALYPEWVRWNGEQAGLPQQLIDRAVTAAAF